MITRITKGRKRAARIAVAAVVATWAQASVGQTLTTLVQTGDPSNRVDAVFLGDGYTQTDLDAGVFAQHVGSYVDYLFGPSNLVDPFDRYANFFNVHAIEVVSNESGADKPPEGVFRDTALDATYYSFGAERLLTVNNAKANAARNAALVGTGITADMQHVTVNDPKYGGAGGAYAVFAGANPSAHEVALHEVGHSFSGLADEYVSFEEPYPFGEPSEVNVTADPTGAKWERWLGYDDPRGSQLDIGVFEGARYYETGAYRPSRNSKMRSLNRAFDAVSREKIIWDIYDTVDPIDDRTPGFFLADPEQLWVDVVDPEVILVEWYVDDVPLAGFDEETLDVAAAGLAPGSYEVTALAYDEVLDHAFTGGPLDLVRDDFFKLQQTVSWIVQITETPLIPGDYDGDGAVGVGDYFVWRDNFGSTVNLAADGNGNGVVDAADFTVFRDAFSSVANAVPEPGALVATLPALLVQGSRQRGDRRFDRR